MKCWRIDIHRKLVAYLHGMLNVKSRLIVEDHLTNCDTCRDRVSYLQQIEQSVKEIPAMSAPENTWQHIEAALQHHTSAPQHKPRITMRMIAGTAGAFIAAMFVFLIWNGQEYHSHFNAETYRHVSIAQIPQSEEPHVATVGYVSEVSMDEDDGDLTFKLVDDLHRPTHFVICEIIPPIKMDTPPIGSRIRVYGVTRYDSKADHQWFEVHPVLNIEPVR